MTVATVSTAAMPVILVSYRGPVEHRLDRDGTVRSSAVSGGLISGLLGIPGISDVHVWVCAAISDADRQLAHRRGATPFEATVRDRRLTLRVLPLDPERQRLMSNVAANPLLWFVQHDMGDLTGPSTWGAAEHVAFQAYTDMNRVVADAVGDELEAAGPDGVVMLHDYQLYLVAETVRERRPDAFLTHFVHVPWPSPASWQMLPQPWGERLLRGLLANDVVGLHTPGYVRAFLDCCEQLLDAEVDRSRDEVVLDGRRVAVRAYPLSPYSEALRQLACAEEVTRERAELRSRRPERLVVRVDRADPTKNILRGFDAWERLLVEHPEHRERAVMRAVVQPTRQGVPVYREYLSAVVASAEALNARLGTTSWRPVDLVLADGHACAVAALQEYDVLLVNPIRDGMNLVAKEGLLLNERDGVLVLSERAGAHDALAPWVLGVHPLDVPAQVAALQLALTMPRAERRTRLVGARAWLEHHDARWWLAEQLRDIAELRASSQLGTSSRV